MRIIALGDTHGRTDWKEIIAKETFDKIVFHGDYFDTHDKISFEQQMNNFIDIINYKRENVDKVILLLGNHDHHYLASTNVTGSGLQKKNKINKNFSGMFHRKDCSIKGPPCSGGPHKIKKLRLSG